MHHRIVSILRRFQKAPAQQLDRAEILDACRQVKHTWRSCLLDPVAIIHLFLNQILHGNTAINHLVRISGLSFTGSAYCQARSRLPLALFRELLRRVAEKLRPAVDDTETWHGHRVFVADGSGFSMPDTPELHEHFGQPSGQQPGCGFPVAHLLALFHVGTGMLMEVVTAPLCTHDMSGVAQIHPKLRKDDILLGDRGLCSFAHLALLLARGAHGVFRIHQRQIVDFTPHRVHARPSHKRGTKGLPHSRWVRGLGLTDHVVAWLKPKQPPEWMTAEQYASLPEQLIVRELRYRTGRAGFRVREVTLVTTLVDAELYPLEELAELYRRRWEVEGHLKALKTTMKMDVLRCETVAGVSKELLLFALVYNLVRLVMLEASRRQEVPVDRISFVDALRWLTEARPGAVLPKLVVNPDRADRVEPRVRKRRPKQYPLMKKPRSQLRKSLLEQRVAA
jgi:Transposase DDE domain